MYPTTAWRHIQRSKKAKFANEVQGEIDCCSLAEPTEESGDNFEENAVYACGFHLEDASEEFCNFAENERERNSELSMGDHSDVDSMLNETGSNVDGDESESEREDEGAHGDDINKFVCDAILHAVEMKDQMSCSIQNFEDLLQWGKELYSKNSNIADNATTKWPSNWEEVCSLLENIGYSNPKLYWVCLDSRYPCLYAVLENKEDCYTKLCNMSLMSLRA